MPNPDRSFFLVTDSARRVERAFSGPYATASLLMYGEDGVGKSSSVYHAVGGRAQTLVLHGTPSPGRAPYHPIAEALSSIADRAARSDRLRDVAVGLGTDMLRLLPILGTFGESLAQAYRDWGVSGIAPITSAYDVVYQVQKILARLAEKQRVVTLFEDVAMYDEASLSLLETLLKNSSLPVSCVLTLDPLTLVDLSPEERRRFARFESQVVRSGFRSVEFHSLDPGETQAFLDGYLAPNSLTAEQVRAMHAVTGGNPLFLKELVGHLLEEEVLRTDNGAFSIHPGYRFSALPRSLSQLIDMRLDRLQRELRDVIDVAAVLGPEFNPQPISGALKLEHLVTLRRLKELEAAHRLILESARSHAFSYRSIRDRIYEQLGPAMAREHHLLIAAYLEQHPLLEDNAYLVYTHFAQAGELRRALPHLRQAAFEARARSGFAAAAERLYEASRLTRELERDDAVADELLFNAALSGVNAGLFDQAVERLGWLAERARHKPLRAAALLQLGLTQWIGDGPQEALRNLNLLLEHHGGELDERAEVEARLALSSVLYHMGEWETARSHYRKCFRTYALRTDSLLRARVRRCINMFYGCEASLPLLRESLRDVEDLRDLPLHWELRHNIACNHMMFGELAEARAMFQDVLEWFDAVGTYRAIFAENNLGIISLAEGRYDEAERRFRRVAATPASPFERISADCQLAVLRVLQDDPGGVDAIEALVPEVLARAEAFTREMVFHNLGWGQIRIGRLDEAARNLLRALPEHSRPGSDLETGRVHTLLKRLANAGVRLTPDVRASPEAGLLERTGRRERWWYTAMDYKSNDLWCWE